MTNTIFGKKSHINRAKAKKYNNGLSAEDLRENRGKELFHNGHVSANNDGTFSVKSSKLNEVYIVELELLADNSIIFSCSCADHQSRGSKCKHIIATLLHIETEKTITINNQ